jgi:transcriptional regulator with XRE-family HTH domain
MTGSEMREARRKLDLGRVEFARLLGYTGTDSNDETRIKQYENDRRPDGVPPYLARLIWLILIWHRNTGDLPPFPGYKYQQIEDPSRERRRERAKKCTTSVQRRSG